MLEGGVLCANGKATREMGIIDLQHRPGELGGYHQARESLINLLPSMTLNLWRLVQSPAFQVDDDKGKLHGLHEVCRL